MQKQEMSNHAAFSSEECARTTETNPQQIRQNPVLTIGRVETKPSAIPVQLNSTGHLTQAKGADRQPQQKWVLSSVSLLKVDGCTLT